MKDSDNIPAMMQKLGQRAKAAAAELGFAPAAQRQKALEAAADAVWAKRAEIIAANAEDLEFGRNKGLSDAMMDRLMLDEARIQGIVDGLRAVAGQDDPVGEVLAEWDQPSGLNIRRVRTPLGVIGVIYESRPNVTADAGALCLKSGNAVILRGGSESFHSSGIIHTCLVEGLKAAGLPEDAIQLVPTRDRAAVQELLTMTEFVDVIVPRGGKGLVGLVQRQARVPVFAHLEGIVHIYVDKAADPQKALDVVLNAKTPYRHLRRCRMSVGPPRYRRWTGGRSDPLLAGGRCRGACRRNLAAGKYPDSQSRRLGQRIPRQCYCSESCG